MGAREGEHWRDAQVKTSLPPDSGQKATEITRLHGMGQPGSVVDGLCKQESVTVRI